MDIEESVRNLSYSPEGDHLSIETVYRLVIADILPQYDKIVYLDCDTIILKDIALLCMQDIGDSVLGAVRGRINESLAEYCRNTLEVAPSEYFNAGVLIVNARQFKKQDIQGKCFALLNSRGRDFKMHDQDVLNIACQNQVMFLDQRWNFRWMHIAFNMRPLLFENGLDLDEVMSDSCIIHYNGGIKPWARPDIEMAEYFWRYARNSIYYEEILLKNFKNPDATDCFKNYIFPFKSIKRNKKIILYGAGRVGAAFYNQLKSTQYGDLLLWCDKNYKNIKTSPRIMNPMLIRDFPYDYIVIAVKDENVAQDIKNDLIGMGVSDTRIIWENPSSF